MAEVKYPVTFVNKDSKEKLIALNETQAAAFKKAGWEVEKKK